MSKSSKRWLSSRKRDQYVKRARRENYRSRAVFKLKEIDQHYRLLSAGHTVIDLGAAPGGWTQYVAERTGPRGRVVAVDVLAMEPLQNVTFIQGDFTDSVVFDSCLQALDGRRADLVISDMAPNLTGVRITDQARSLELAELALDFARRTLKPDGKFLVKLFEGTDIAQFRRDISSGFQKVTTVKPDASRAESRELYVLAQGYEV